MASSLRLCAKGIAFSRGKSYIVNTGIAMFEGKKDCET